MEGFFGGILIGYALKNVIKILSIVVGLFLAGLANLQYHQIARINWGKLQSVLRVYYQILLMQQHKFLITLAANMIMQQL